MKHKQLQSTILIIFIESSLNKMIQEFFLAVFSLLDNTRETNSQNLILCEISWLTNFTMTILLDQVRTLKGDTWILCSQYLQSFVRSSFVLYVQSIQCVQSAVLMPKLLKIPEASKCMY